MVVRYDAPACLIDSSAWIEFLRNTGSPECELVHDLLEEHVAICEPVRMEILSGARDDLHLRKLRSLIAIPTMIPVTPADFDEAAALYRRCVRVGQKVRKSMDCLIAAVAIRAGLPLLHCDRDFASLERNTELLVYRRHG